MKAFAVSHNGKKVAVVGATENCWLHVMLSGLVTVSPQATCQIRLQLSRATMGDGSERKPLDTWPAPELAVGDEITIRILDVESDDPPPKRGPRRKKPDPDFDFNSRFGRHL